MPTRKKRNQDLLNDFVLPDDDLAEFVQDSRFRLLEFFEDLCVIRSGVGMHSWVVGKSMGHRPEDDVDTERVGLLFGELAEVIFVLPFSLPTIAVVGVVADHNT